MHFLEEEASPGEVRQDSLMYSCILQNGVQPSSFVAYLIFCRVWVCSSASFVRQDGEKEKLWLAVPPPLHSLHAVPRKDRDQRRRKPITCRREYPCFDDVHGELVWKPGKEQEKCPEPVEWISCKVGNRTEEKGAAA